MPDNRYMKLNLGWADSDWVSEMSDGGKLAWVFLIGYCKSLGIGGRVKAISVTSFARRHFISESSAKEGLTKALEHGAITAEDDLWVFPTWRKHQGDETGTERQRRYRNRKNKVEEVLERDNFTCQTCGAKDDLVIDHVIPVALGGDTTMENLQALCRTCNLKKGSKSNGGNALRRDSNDSNGEERRGDITPIVPKGTARFVPPTIEECIAYGPQIKLPEKECRAFWFNKSSNGWKVGRTAMKNWKSAMVTWRDSDYRKPDSNGTSRLQTLAEAGPVT